MTITGLRQRFDIRRICIVADRGMISKAFQAFGVAMPPTIRKIYSAIVASLAWG
jgi:hypothetical protein